MDVTGNADLFGGRVPVVIGVTGHRSLTGMEDKIAGAAAAVCRNLKASYPSTPFLVLTGLAEGADRLVAEILLRELDARLCAVLPLPPEEYAKDFAGDASRQAFEALLAKAARRVDVYNIAEAARWSEPGEGRNVQYARQGGLLAEHAQILIAVWDGEGPRGTGGTAQVVEWFRQGTPPKRFSAFPGEVKPLDPSEPGLLVHIDAKTAQTVYTEAGAETAPGKPRGAEARRSSIREILKCTDRFNRDALGNTSRIAGNWPVMDPLPAGAARETGAVYRASDALAVHYANRVRHADYFVYGLALLAVFFFNMTNNWPVASWAYLVTAGAMAAALFYLWFRSLDARFIEYRGLAEAARVLFFLRLSGIATPVWLQSMSKHAGAVRWVRQSVRTLEFCDDHRPGAGGAPDGLALTKAAWVDGQISYYRRAGARHWRRYQMLLRIEKVAFVLSFAIAFVLSVAAYMSVKAGQEWHLFQWAEEAIPGTALTFRTATDQLQLVLGLLAALGIAVRAFLVRRADLELAKQFAATLQMFERAGRGLEEAEAQGAAAEWTQAEIVAALGHQALQENAEWLWVRHSRPFEMPN